MYIYPEKLNYSQIYTAKIDCNTNLPSFIADEFSVNVKYYLEPYLANINLIYLKIDCQVAIFCERCGKKFLQNFFHDFSLAICQSDDLAEKIMESYEPVVISNNAIDLQHIVIDEIILSCHKKHNAQEEQCLLDI